MFSDDFDIYTSDTWAETTEFIQSAGPSSDAEKADADLKNSFRGAAPGSRVELLQPLPLIGRQPRTLYHVDLDTAHPDAQRLRRRSDQPEDSDQIEGPQYDASWPHDAQKERIHPSQLTLMKLVHHSSKAVRVDAISSRPVWPGEHYTVSDVQFLPTPLQRPRIPIWVAPMYRHRRPLLRAARWDDLVPMHETELSPTPAQVDEVVSVARSHRTVDGPIDVNVPVLLSANRSGIRPLVRDYEAAGATWLQVGAWSLDELRVQIAAGPPVD